jgi:hypothetical protein
LAGFASGLGRDSVDVKAFEARVYALNEVAVVVEILQDEARVAIRTDLGARALVAPLRTRPALLERQGLWIGPRHAGRFALKHVEIEGGVAGHAVVVGRASGTLCGAVRALLVARISVTARY